MDIGGISGFRGHEVFCAGNIDMTWMYFTVDEIKCLCKLSVFSMIGIVDLNLGISSTLCIVVIASCFSKSVSLL